MNIHMKKQLVKFQIRWYPQAFSSSQKLNEINKKKINIKQVYFKFTFS